MSGHGRPSVDVHARLEAAEWRELFGEALRLSGFWTRTASAAGLVVVAAAVAAVLGTPTTTALAVGLAALAALVVFTASYTLVGPRLRWPRIPPELLAAHWRVGSDGIVVERAGALLTLEWNDVDQVVLTRRLLVLHLGAHRDVLGLPRRSATPLGESLIATWAEDSGAEVVRRSRSQEPVS